MPPVSTIRAEREAWTTVTALSGRRAERDVQGGDCQRARRDCPAPRGHDPWPRHARNCARSCLAPHPSRPASPVRPVPAATLRSHGARRRAGHRPGALRRRRARAAPRQRQRRDPAADARRSAGAGVRRARRARRRSRAPGRPDAARKPGAGGVRGRACGTRCHGAAEGVSWRGRRPGLPRVDTVAIDARVLVFCAAVALVAAAAAALAPLLAIVRGRPGGARRRPRPRHGGPQRDAPAGACSSPASSRSP